MNILEAFANPQLFSGSFDGESREAWRAVLSGAFALPMDEDRAALFKQLSGGREAPAERVSELWCIAGRRSDKTHTAAGIAVYLGTVGAAIEGLTDKLTAGERGVISVVATDKSQAKVALGYIDGLIEASAALSAMVLRRDAEAIHLNNRVSIEVTASSYRAIRGRTLLAVILDECAFFRSEQTALPDVELYRAALPGLATVGGLLVGISSPYSKKGILYDKYRRHYGKAGSVLVVQGASRDFNPTLPQSLVDQALEDDPEAARSEWLGQFRDDISAFLARDAVEQCVRSGPLELPFDKAHRYQAFVDPAGGGADEYTLSIAHREGDQIIVDLVRGMRGIPASITAEYAIVLKSYRITCVKGDKYGGSWPGDEFRKHGITYEAAGAPKSDLYVDFLPLVNSARVQLPPDDKLITQLCALERRTARSGKDSIDHSPGAHDDLANAAAGVGSLSRKPTYDLAAAVGDEPKFPHPVHAYLQ